MRKLLRISIPFLLVLAGLHPGRCQLPLHATTRIGNHTIHDHRFDGRHPVFLGSESPSPLVRYNPFTLTFGGLLYFYQGVLSPQIMAECRFQLSCSSFSRSAITEFGLLKGVALTADRIMKCNRLTLVDVRPGTMDFRGKLADVPSLYRIRQ